MPMSTTLISGLPLGTRSPVRRTRRPLPRPWTRSDQRAHRPALRDGHRRPMATGRLRLPAVLHKKLTIAPYPCGSSSPTDIEYRPRNPNPYRERPVVRSADEAARREVTTRLVEQFEAEPSVVVGVACRDLLPEREETWQVLVRRGAELVVTMDVHHDVHTAAERPRPRPRRRAERTPDRSNAAGQPPRAPTTGPAGGRRQGPPWPPHRSTSHRGSSGPSPNASSALPKLRQLR